MARATTKEYKAVANFFKNTTGALTNAEIRSIVREVVREEIHAWLNMHVNMISNMVVEHTASWRNGSAFRQDLAEAVAKRYEIDIKMKPKT